MEFVLKALEGIFSMVFINISFCLFLFIVYRFLDISSIIC